MEIESFNGVAFKPSSESGGLGGTASLAETFDNFLTLLTTQLQNQDPLEPLDSNEFTQQLVQFTGVEQQVNTNKKLDRLLQMQGSGQAASAVGYIGKTVEVDADRLALQDGRAEFTYTLESNARETAILISDALGRTVRVMPGPKDAGQHRIDWDGTDANGVTLPDGVYGLTIRALGPNEEEVGTSTTVLGRATGVDSSDGGLKVMIGDLEVPLEKLRAVRALPEKG